MDSLATYQEGIEFHDIKWNEKPPFYQRRCLLTATLSSENFHLNFLMQHFKKSLYYFESTFTKYVI